MLRLIDGWDYLNTGAQTALLAAMGWSGDHSRLFINNTSPRFGYGNYVRMQPANFTDHAQRVMPQNFCVSGSMAYVGMAFRVESGWSDQYTYIKLLEALSNVTHISIGFSNENGVLKVQRGYGSPTVLATVGPGVFVYDRWFYLEIGMSILDVGGSVEVRVNGVTVCSIPSADTAASANLYWNLFGLGWSSLSPAVWMDDMYICDDSGSTNNTFLGNSRVKSLLPVGAGSMTNWDPSNIALPNWQNAINKAVDDSLYVYTPTIGEQDLYTVDPMVNAPNVFGVSVKGTYRQDDATQRYVKNALKSGATLDRGSLYATYENYTFKEDVWNTNPDTGVAFTGSEVNALEIGPYLDS